MPQELDDEQREARRKVTAAKKMFTRQFNATGKVTQFASNHPSATAATATNESKTRLTKAYDEVMEALEEMAYLEPQNEDVEKSKDDVQKRFEEMELRVLETLRDCTPNQLDRAAERSHRTRREQNAPTLKQSAATARRKAT